MKRIVMVMVALWMGGAQGGTYYVKPDGNDGNAGIGWGDFSCLQCARGEVNWSLFF